MANRANTKKSRGAAKKNFIQVVCNEGDIIVLK